MLHGVLFSRNTCEMLHDVLFHLLNNTYENGVS